MSSLPSDSFPSEQSLDPTFASGSVDPVEVFLRMSDGTRLATDVYLPRRPANRQQWPTLLARLPYGKRGLVAFMPTVASYLLERGYAVVIQDVRGKFGSEGQQTPFIHEAQDGYDTLEWISAQRWCNGRIGMFGDSYYGFTQWAAAASGHRSLHAIVPRVTSTRLVSDWFFQGGVFCLETMADWAAQTWTQSDLSVYARDWNVRPLSKLVPEWLDGRRSASLDRWMAAGSNGEYWDTLRRVQPDPSRIGIPVLHLGGAWDVFRRGQFWDWRRGNRAGRSNHYLSFSAVDHLGLRIPEDGHGPAYNWMATASDMEVHIAEYLSETCNFLDEHLRDRAVSRSTVTYEIPGLGRYESPQWPPAGVVGVALHPSRSRDMSGPEGGVLDDSPSSREQVVLWVQDPKDLVPSLEADPWGVLFELPDERRVEAREDVVTFTASEQLEDLILLGPAQVHLEVSSSAQTYQIVAKLVHVFSDGFARRIAVGAATGTASYVKVDFGDLAYRIPRGEHLRLEIAGSSFPRYLPVFGDEAGPWQVSNPSETIEYRLRVGRGTSTIMHLSVHPNFP